MKPENGLPEVTFVSAKGSIEERAIHPLTIPRNQIMLDRVTDFGIRVATMADALPSTPSAFVLSKQVVRSSTSIGANYREAQFARTGKEFVSKLQISLQETEETRHWLTTIQGCGHITNEPIDKLEKECSELIAILVTSINTARRGRVS